jgi:hypothetical protein
MPTTIEIPHYQLDTNDKQSIGTFLELGKKYKLFEVYEDSSGEHYRYLPQLNMLAYLSSTFDEQKCIRFLNASM